MKYEKQFIREMTDYSEATIDRILKITRVTAKNTPKQICLACFSVYLLGKALGAKTDTELFAIADLVKEVGVKNIVAATERYKGQWLVTDAGKVGFCDIVDVLWWDYKTLAKINPDKALTPRPAVQYLLDPVVLYDRHVTSSKKPDETPGRTEPDPDC